MRRAWFTFTALFCLGICCLTTACSPSIRGIDSTSGNQAGAPVQLKFKTEPSATAGAGIVFSTMPVVELEDSSGTVVTSATEPVTLVAYTDATCTTIAPGTFVVTNNNLTPTSGEAAFTGVNYGGATTTLYIGASATGLTSACSNAITITPGNPAKLGFSTEPSTTAGAGINLAAQPVVSVEDGYGNVIPSATNSISLASYTDSACTSAASGTLGATANPVSASSGNASFSGVNYGGTTATIYIGASTSGLTSACSTGVAITAGTPTKLIFSTEPSSSESAGVALGTQPTVSVDDAYGNLVTTATNSVTLASYSDNACTTSAAGTLGATTNPLAASSGNATFAGVNYGGTSGATIYIGASAGGLTSACSTGVSITPGNPAKLIFSTEPSTSGTAGVAFVTQPAVTVEDAYSNVVTSATNSITLAPYTNSTCTTAGTGTFGATTNPLAASSGVASFSGVNYTKSGTLYIGASASGLTSACSSAVSVAAGPPAQLAWSWGSGNTALVNGCEATPGPITGIEVQDSYGNVATVTGSPLTINLVGGGSTVWYSNNTCTSPITSATIPAGSSSTGTLYLSDSAVETVSEYATATGLTAISPMNNAWKLKPVLSFSPPTFMAGSCEPFTITAEDANGTATAESDK